MSTHSCAYCSQLVKAGDPFCSKCGGPQVYKSAGPTSKAAGGFLASLFGDNAAPQGAVEIDLDPWYFTSPKAIDRLRKDREAGHSLAHTFRHDPNHAQTRVIQDQIRAAQQRGDISDTGRYYYCLPWSPVYKAHKTVTIADTTVPRGKEFAFELSASNIPNGGKFERTIIVGDFRPADRLDYDDIDDEHHDEMQEH